MAMNELASKMIPKKGKSLKGKTITDELARRLNEYNRAAMLDPQPFNEPQPVALGNNPFDNMDFGELLDNDENREEEFIVDNMEAGEAINQEDAGFDLAGDQGEQIVEEGPVVEIGEPGENRPAVEEREEIRPATVAEMRRQWLAQHARPIRITRDDDSEPLVAHRINRLYGNYMPYYGGANGNVTFTFDATSPIAATTVATAQLANATRLVNDTETARDNG
jgi:hypothetical protein